MLFETKRNNFKQKLWYYFCWKMEYFFVTCSVVYVIRYIKQYYLEQVITFFNKLVIASFLFFCSLDHVITIKVFQIAIQKIWRHCWKSYHWRYSILFISTCYKRCWQNLYFKSYLFIIKHIITNHILSELFFTDSILQIKRFRWNNVRLKRLCSISDCVNQFVCRSIPLITLCFPMRDSHS